MKTFNPRIVIFRENALEYPLGEKLYQTFADQEDIETHVVASRGPFPLDRDLTFQKKFIRAKETIVVSVRSLSKFQSCKPSAHYQLPLVTGCPGHCHYCYLNTNLGKNPYIKVYVNLEEILAKAEKYIKEREPEVTIFEGAATSDPLPVEKWTGSLARSIEFFGKKELGRFRFVTKFTEVESLLNIDHNNQTEFRFSLNSKYAVKKFEPTTPTPAERVRAAGLVYQAGYPTGFLIAPIFIYDDWQEEYDELLKSLKETINSQGSGLSFELITHRFTERAKKIIEKVYPETPLPMNEETRQFKYGQFGYGKYVYPPETMNKIETFMKEIINKYFPEAEIKYFV